MNAFAKRADLAGAKAVLSEMQADKARMDFSSGEKS